MEPVQDVSTESNTTEPPAAPIESQPIETSNTKKSSSMGKIIAIVLILAIFLLGLVAVAAMVLPGLLDNDPTLSEEETISCSYNGASYSVGQGFDATDGCNSCSCGSDGEVICTQIACNEETDSEDQTPPSSESTTKEYEVDLEDFFSILNIKTIIPKNMTATSDTEASVTLSNSKASLTIENRPEYYNIHVDEIAKFDLTNLNSNFADLYKFQIDATTFKYISGPSFDEACPNLGEMLSPTCGINGIIFQNDAAIYVECTADTVEDSKICDQILAKMEVTRTAKN